MMRDRVDDLAVRSSGKACIDLVLSGGPILRHGDLDQLPLELILEIAELASTADAVSLSLTNKHYFELLSSTYIPRLMEKPIPKRTERQRFLVALERDLPWQFYSCSTCTRLHYFQYEQPKCAMFDHIDISFNTQFAKIQRHNVRLVKKKFYAQARLTGRVDFTESISLTFRSDSVRFWSYYRVQPGADGQLYGRGQDWLRCTRTELPYRGMEFLYLNYTCWHDIMFRRPGISIYGIWLKASKKELEGMSFEHLLDKSITNTRGYHLQPSQKMPRTTMPECWRTAFTNWCPLCNLGYTVHVGFTAFDFVHGELMPNGQQCDAGSQLQSQVRFPDQDSARSRMKFWKSKAKKKGTVELAHAETYYLCDTMVITKWMCLGNNCHHEHQQDCQCSLHRPLSKSKRFIGPKSLPDVIQAAFNGQPLLTRNPAEYTTLDPPPCWTQEEIWNPQPIDCRPSLPLPSVSQGIFL